MQVSVCNSQTENSKNWICHSAYHPLPTNYHYFDPLNTRHLILWSQISDFISLHPPWFLGGVRTGKGFLPAISVPNISQPASIPRGCSKTTTCRARPNQVLSHHDIGTQGIPKIDRYMQYKNPKINGGMTIQYGYYMYMICTYMYICIHNHYTHSILQYMVPFQ